MIHNYMGGTTLQSCHGCNSKLHSEKKNNNNNNMCTTSADLMHRSLTFLCEPCVGVHQQSLQHSLSQCHWMDGLLPYRTASANKIFIIET